MIGVGRYTFVDDWAQAASLVAKVYGMRSVTGRRVWVPGPTVVPVPGPGVMRYDVRSVRTRGVGWVPRLVESLSARAIVAVVREVEKSEGPVDLIHSHFYSASVGVPEAAKTLGVPYVHTEHSTWLLTSERGRTATPAGLNILRRVAADASTLFVVSESLREAMVGHGIDARYEVLGNPVNSSLFAVRTGGRIGPSRLVTVGGIVPHKRHELLIRALHLMGSTRPDISLTIVGDGPIRSHLEDLSRQLRVSSRVRFVGSVDRSVVAEELSSADVYVHSSSVETFGVSIIEALLSGLPVVTTACGGVVPSMPPSLPVTVVDPASPEALADAIQKTMTEVGHLDRNRIAVIAASRFGLHTAARRLKVAYESAVGR